MENSLKLNVIHSVVYAAMGALRMLLLLSSSFWLARKLNCFKTVYAFPEAISMSAPKTAAHYMRRARALSF